MVRRLRSENPQGAQSTDRAALFPLYVNAASRERATKVAAAAESRLLKPGGLTTTTVNSGQQWDAPNGWAPLQWVAVEGLQNYGQQKIAMEVTWRFLTNVQHTMTVSKSWWRSMT
ncbi:Periplasmic trehalase precursor [Serratia liquefaciens]|nr:Periplasmic trehalase precursor [Serratia liquefaciens]